MGQDDWIAPCWKDSLYYNDDADDAFDGDDGGDDRRPGRCLGLKRWLPPRLRGWSQSGKVPGEQDDDDDDDDDDEDGGI